jgi:outer membrane protein TolC
MFVTGLLLACAASAASARAPSTSTEAPGPLAPGGDFHAVDSQLSGLVAALLEQNPEARSARAFSRSRLERAPRERSLPDPSVTYRYFAQSPETRVGPQRHAVEISQGVPWFGKRELQARRATHEATGVAWHVRDLERDLVAELKRDYFEAAYLQEALAVNSDETQLLRRFERIALTRYSTGEGIQQSVIKVQTDISRLADRETALRERLDAVTRRIVQLTGADPALHLAPISLGLVELDSDPQDLAHDAMREHPRLRAIRAAIRADEAWLHRRKLDARPDFRFGLGYVDVGSREDAAGRLNPPEDNGEDAWSVTVGVNVPLFRKRIRSGVAEARESARSNELLLESARDELEYAVRESMLRLESILERARLYRDVIVPQAEQSLASAEAAHATNRQSFLDLLDAERVLFQVRLTHHRLLADHWIALADLERALGQPFPAQGSGI